MKPNSALLSALLAAVVAAATAATTTYLFLRYAPLAPDSADQKRIERIIWDYLINKPEILVEMTNELDKRQAAEQSVQQQKAISQNANAIFRVPVTHVAGNPNGDVNVVEFFDYNCPYCRHALPDVLKLINEDFPSATPAPGRCGRCEPSSLSCSRCPRTSWSVKSTIECQQSLGLRATNAGSGLNLIPTIC